jgi:hypothetical protein
MDVVARHLLAVPDTLDPWAVQWLADSAESMLYSAPQVCRKALRIWARIATVVPMATSTKRTPMMMSNGRPKVIM